MIKKLGIIKNESYKGIDVSPLKPFTKNDWNGYAGAEEFSNGDQPLLYEDDDIALIVDKNGIEIYAGDVYDPITYYCDSTSLIKSMKIAKKALSNKDMDLLDFCDFLESLGFTEI